MPYYFPKYTNTELLQGLPSTTEQNTPENGYMNKNLVPQEKVPTIEDYNRQYSEGNYRNFRDNFPYPSLSPREFNARNQVFGHKLAWQNAQEQINALDANKDAEKIAELKQAQKDHSDAATVLRNTAKNMGWNMLGLGENDTFDVATQLMNMDKNRGMSELYDMPTTTAQIRDTYYQMIDSGVSPHMARAAAERMGDEFREKNISRLIEGIGAYGLNGNGSLNDFGQMLAGKLYTESPYQYGNIVNSYASPKDLFNINATMAQSAMNNDNAFKNLVYQTEHNERNLDKTLEHQSQEKALDRDHSLKMTLINNALKSAGMEQSSEMDKEINNLARLLEGDEQKARELYLYRHYGSAIEKMMGDDSLIKDEAKLLKFADGQFGSIEYFLRNGDMQTAQNLINQFREAMLGIDFKYAEQNNRERANEILQTLDDYSKVANGEMTFEQLLEKTQGAWGDSWLSLKQRERSNDYWKTIEQAKAIGEEAAKRNRTNTPSIPTNTEYYPVVSEEYPIIYPEEWKE